MIDGPPQKKKCVLYTAALGDGLKYMLPLSDEFADEYLISAHTLYRTDRIADDVPALSAELRDCRLLICHHPDTIIVGNPEQRDAHELIVASVPADCRVVRIPFFYCPALWPFHCADPRNYAQFPKDRHGRYRHYESGDAYILECLNKGDAPEAVIQHYLDLDVSSIIDLDARLARTLEGARAADSLSDIHVATCLEETFGLSSPFSAYYLPSNSLLLCFTNEILRLLGFHTLPERILYKLQPLLRPQIPIHPSIGRHFGLPYITEQTRYLLDRQVHEVSAHHHHIDSRRRLTFMEYIQDYVYFV